MHLELLQKAIKNKQTNKQTNPEATGDLIGSKIANKIRKDSPQKLVHKRKKIIEIPKNVYNFRENINIMIIHHLRVISQFNNGISKSNKLVRQYAKSIIQV